jgi:hypothetical protein
LTALEWRTTVVLIHKPLSSSNPLPTGAGAPVRSIVLGRRPDSVGTGVAFSPTPSAALRYWNLARQRYCRRLARYRHTLRVSADPVAKPAAHTGAESRGSRLSKPGAGERRTLRWRKTDSNPRSPPCGRGTVPRGRTGQSQKIVSLSWGTKGSRTFLPPPAISVSPWEFAIRGETGRQVRRRDGWRSGR